MVLDLKLAEERPVGVLHYVFPDKFLINSDNFFTLVEKIFFANTN